MTRNSWRLQFDISIICLIVIALRQLMEEERTDGQRACGEQPENSQHARSHARALSLRSCATPSV